ncbi:DUF2007 domain-containing protein [Flavobacterium sp. DG1-102-2]|uniref:putative signal transducing protein n=1 Tax=Flavobacterium sp. DG1-102-2 TaxID=3081663 RepID=UPI00294A1787|nr:DUF2007 domain-containing protein [Flavobacterium sp. DG1-102-2]MDV6169838.1 DUF2007 domain-containing protein [Flavobacterium sp. DG1-102-2]
MALVKVFSGSEILAQSLKVRIEAAGVNVIVKNNIQSSNMAGFGSLGQAVEVFIEDKDKEKAAQAIEDFKMGN